MSLICRISVIVNVPILRYGMMSAKGHCINLPQKMSVATHLPLLPSEVEIVVLINLNKILVSFLVVSCDVV